MKRRIRVHQQVAGGISLSALSIWLAHHLSPELEALFGVMVAVLAAWSADIESAVRWMEGRAERADSDLESEL